MLVAVAIFAFGLMAHASSNLAAQNLTRAEARNSVALQTVKGFTEALRSDTEWETLYGFLCDRLDMASAHPCTMYVSDFPVPAELGAVEVRVDVPRSAPVDGSGGAGGGTVPGDGTLPGGEEGGSTAPILREDVSMTTFGLPYDLNGDGTMDADARDGDYLVLPMRITFRWSAPGEAPQELTVFSWLRGERP